MPRPRSDTSKEHTSIIVPKEKTDGLMYKELSAFTTQRSKTVKDFQPNTLENCPQEKLIWRN